MATVAHINTNLTATTGNLEKGIKRGEQVIKGFAGRMKGFAFALPNAQRIIAGSVAALGIRAIFGKVKEQLDSLGSLFDQAISLGIEPQKLQALGFAAEQAGSSSEELQKAMAKMANATADAVDGNKAAGAAFKSLGLDAKRMQSLAPDEQLFRVADALAAIQNPSERIQLAMDIFGRSGARLISLLSGGSSELRRMQEEFRKLGGTMTALDFAAADMAGDALHAMGTALDNLANNLIVSASPAIILLSQSFGELIGATGEAAKANYALSRIYFETVGFIGDVIQVIGELFGIFEEGPFRASDLIHEKFKEIIAEIEASAKRARGAGLPKLPPEGAGAGKRKAEAGAFEKGSAKAIEAINKAFGATTKENWDRKNNGQLANANTKLDGIRRALERPGVKIVAAGLA